MNALQRKKFAKALMNDLRNATDDEKLQGLLDADKEYDRGQKEIDRLTSLCDKLREDNKRLKAEVEIARGELKLARQGVEYCFNQAQDEQPDDGVNGWELKQVITQMAEEVKK